MGRRRIIRWTEEEEQLLRDEYPDIGYRVCDLPEFSHRTPVSIIWKAEAMRLKEIQVKPLWV